MSRLVDESPKADKHPLDCFARDFRPNGKVPFEERISASHLLPRISTLQFPCQEQRYSLLRFKLRIIDVYVFYAVVGAREFNSFEDIYVLGMSLDVLILC